MTRPPAGGRQVGGDTRTNGRCGVRSDDERGRAEFDDAEQPEEEQCWVWVAGGVGITEAPA